MNTKYKIYKFFLLGILLIFSACSDSFLQQSPQGQLADDQINNTKGVEYLLIGAYGLMNGNPSGTWGNYAAAPSQWLFGEVAADKENKGSEPSDQERMMGIERHAPISDSEHLEVMWN